MFRHVQKRVYYDEGTHTHTHAYLYSWVYLQIVVVTNPVRGLPSDCHKRLPLHHIDSHTTQTVTCHSRLQFPSSIALITHTQLNALITHTQLKPIRHAVHLVLPCCLVPDLLPVYLGLTLCLLFRTVFAPRLDYCSCYLDYLSCQALWILFAERKPTLALGIFFALSVMYLCYLTLACFLTAPL